MVTFASGSFCQLVVLCCGIGHVSSCRLFQTAQPCGGLLLLMPLISVGRSGNFRGPVGFGRRASQLVRVSLVQFEGPLALRHHFSDDREEHLILRSRGSTSRQ
ncbi:hypothetical protein EDB83DRAFT_87206 [Lactarius deliciosus]|nr:hypothetical protein EDB83DRAFT_87206 [Lactarius deliciosus]